MTSNLGAEKNPLVQILRAWDPAAVAEANEFRGELTIELARENALRVAEFLRHEKGLEFSFLSDISAVDRFPTEPRFELNYHLLSIPNRQTLRLRVRAPGAGPVVDSMIPVWPTANWHEREAYDLFGVRFEGHPELRRIL